MTTEAAPQSLYEQLGAEVGIAGAVDNFYGRVFNDEFLAPFFTGVDMAQQKRHMVYFLSAATGGPVKYEGRAMAEAHARHNITDAHFDRVVEHLAATLADLGVDSETISQVATALTPLRQEVVTTSG
jgi:hemoglobin